MPSTAMQRWTVEQRFSAHRRVADNISTAPSDDVRFFHLLLAGDSAPVAIEAYKLFDDRFFDGRTGEAISVVESARMIARGAGDDAAEEALLLRWTKAVLTIGTLPVLDRLLYEFGRSRTTVIAAAAEAMVCARSVAARGNGQRSLEMLDRILPFDDVEVERLRQDCRVYAAQRCSSAISDMVMETAREWATRDGSPQSLARCCHWEGLWMYRNGNFRQAATSHFQGISDELPVTSRLEAMVSGASAALEAGDFDVAESTAKTALALAAKCRNVPYEARAVWMMRAIAYRQERVDAPDEELALIAARIGRYDIEGLLAIYEAAFAWRASQIDVAARLAKQAVDAFRHAGHSRAVLLARCLQLVLGDDATPGEIETLARDAMECPIADVGIQALAMLAKATRNAPDEWKCAAQRLLDQVAPERKQGRLDILSIREALEWIESPTRAKH